MYKLTKKNISVIRKDKAGVDQAIEEGFVLDGECNEKYEVTNPNPVFETKVEKKKTKKED